MNNKMIAYKRNGDKKSENLKIGQRVLINTYIWARNYVND